MLIGTALKNYDMKRMRGWRNLPRSINLDIWWKRKPCFQWIRRFTKVYLDLVSWQQYSCICRWVLEDRYSSRTQTAPYPFLNTSSLFWRLFKSYAKFSVSIASFNTISNYEFYIFTDVPSCSKVQCYQRFGPNYLLHFRRRINFLEVIVTSEFGSSFLYSSRYNAERPCLYVCTYILSTTYR